ncbi:MAG: hypothetical protein QMC90_05685, partial [Dehalococcoidales bacterium]|nr:hypothetical protein [Dehalococcoidales bacterium]
MNIISVDLPWNPGKKGRRAVVVADLDRNIKIMSAKDDDEMLALVRNNAEQESIVLLDIPIEGGEQKFRPVDRALARQGIWIQPSSSAGNRGKRLKELLKDKKGITVQEIYPYAVYKFLAYLKDRKLIGRLKPDRFEVLLDDSFRGFQPWKYKRERKKEERLKNMRYLYSLIMDTGTGLNYHIPLHYP